MEFIQKCSTDLVFSEKWINQIIESITTTSFCILINGIPREPFMAQREVLCREKLSLHIIYYLYGVSWQIYSFVTNVPKFGFGIKVAMGLIILYLMYADGWMIFVKQTGQRQGMPKLLWRVVPMFQANQSIFINPWSNSQKEPKTGKNKILWISYRFYRWH